MVESLLKYQDSHKYYPPSELNVEEAATGGPDPIKPGFVEIFISGMVAGISLAYLIAQVGG